jgi:hypothetical protein
MEFLMSQPQKQPRFEAKAVEAAKQGVKIQREIDEAKGLRRKAVRKSLTRCRPASANIRPILRASIR